MAKQDYYLEENNNYPNLTVNSILNRNGRGFTMEDNDINNTNKHRLIPESLAILNHLLSHSNTWHLSIECMNKTLKLSDYMSRKARAELEKKGFLEQIETRVNGRKAYKYIVYELPKEELKRINQGLENYGQQNDDNKLTEENAAHNNNEKQHEIQQNQSKLKEGNHICGTKSSTNINHSSKENGDTYENMSHGSISKHEVKATTPSDTDKQEIRAKRRARNEVEIHNNIDSREDIDAEIKPLLKDFVSSWKEKGRKVTIIELNNLINELLSKCKTIEGQKESISRAISGGYRYLVTKNDKKSEKTPSNSPKFVNPVDDDDDDGDETECVQI